MTKRLISFFLALCLLAAIPLSATYKYNPYTRKLDYYERVSDADLGDLGDVTITGAAAGNVLYYDGAAWVNLATGANGEFLTLAVGIPAWAAVPAGVTTFIALTDTPGAYAGKAGQLVRVNAGANALEFFAGSPLGTVIIADGAGGWTKTENYRVSAAGAVTLGSWTGTAIGAQYGGTGQNTTGWTDYPYVTAGVWGEDATLAHIANGLEIAGAGASTVEITHDATDAKILSSTASMILETTGGAATIEITGDLLPAADGGYDLGNNTLAWQDMVLTSTGTHYYGDTNVNGSWKIVRDGAKLAFQLREAGAYVEKGYFDATAHVQLPNTIANVLSDHNLAAHTALGLFDASSDVDHNATTNYAANQHVVLPNTIASVLSDHDKAAHDALNIDADTVDGEEAAAIVTNARVKAHFPDTIANILSDHNLLAHTTLGLFDASSDVDHNATTNYAANQHVVLPNTIANVLSDHNLAAHTALGLFDASSDVDHNLTTNYAANQHVVLPNTIANVLSDHNLAAHTALGLFDASGDVDHNLTTNYDANRHVDHTAVSISAAGLISGGGTIASDRTLTLTEATIEAAIDTLANLTSIQGQTVTFSGLLNVEANSNINQDVTSDGSPTFGGLTVTNIFGYDYTTDHNLWVGYLAGEPAVGGQFNTTIGENAGRDITIGDENIVVGGRAAEKLTEGSSNTYLGYLTGYYNKEGNSNVYIGKGAGYGANTKYNSQNVIVGTGAGNQIETGNSNVIVGYRAAEDLTSGASNVAIGHQAGEGWLVAQSNQLIIENTDSTTPLIHGDFSLDTLTINGELTVTDGIFRGDYVVSQEVNWDDVSPVAICAVADGYVVTDVWCEVTTIADGDLAWTVGDGATADGFLTDAGITQGTAGYYGQVHSARGTYLFDTGEEVDKIYEGADTVDCFITESTASQGVIVVYVHVTRLK